MRGKKQESPLSSLPFNTVLELQASAIRQERSIKGIHVAKITVCKFKWNIGADEKQKNQKEHKGKEGKGSFRMILENLSYLWEM